MISDKQIRKLAEEELKGTDNFLVEVLVKPGNRIMVYIDSDSEVNVDDCVKLSRYLEGQFDRDEEDFELLVSSAGLDHAFIMERQYRKYLNRKVEIVPNEGSKITAILTAITADEIRFKKLTVKQKHRAAEEGPEESMLLSEIKETKPAVQFN